MANLTDNELRVVVYYGIGVSSEGGDVAYKLSYAGRTIHENDGSVNLEPVQGSNSGYSIGTLQTDFGAHPEDASALVNSFQDWAKTNRPDWALSAQQQAQLSTDLGRDGNHIRDPNFDADKQTYHGKGHIPFDHMPKAGPDIDQTFKAHLNDYLTTDTGRSFIHQRDVAQVDKLMDSIAPILKSSDFYKNADPQDQAKIFAMVGKAYNQSDAYGRDILNDISHHKISSVDGVSEKIIGLIKRDPKHPEHPTYMESGRDAAISGAEIFNALRNAGQNNAMRKPWQAVVANPLVNPTQLRTDPEQPHLSNQYATVKGLFVQPEQGRALVDALEKCGSHNYGDPSKSNSRGFYAEGNGFVQWDKNGLGRAFVGGQWSEFSRSELSLNPNKDHTLDININRNGETHSLLHVIHPTGHSHAATADAAASSHKDILRQGNHNEQVLRLQTQLGELGYLDNTTTPDGKFGPATASAVEAFQTDHHLTKGSVGPITQGALQADLQPLRQDDSGPLPAVSAMSSLPAGAPGLDDPRNALNPNHALYNKLHQRIPDASENRLLQFTAACRSQGITDRNLTDVHFDQKKGMVSFGGSQNFEAKTASVDVKEPSPPPALSIQHLQQTDQQQVQIQASVQAQIAQNNQQRQGPVAGGPAH